jgi:nucleotide-binding universal stress UspA family protein
VTDEPTSPTRHHTTHQHPVDWAEPLVIPDVKRQVDTILVPVDGSPGSERGLAYADLLAGITSAEVVVVVAYDPPIAIRRRGILLVEAAQREMEEDATELATEAAQLLIDRGRRARGVVVRGEPAESILEVADREHADLIVMGRRGLGRLQGLIVGSVSERVARHAGVPVFLAT